MNNQHLHEVIKQVIKQARRPLTFKEIEQIIFDKKLWQRPSDDDTPSKDQIRARIAKHKDTFIVEYGYVRLLERRLLRLTWNTNGWQLPSGHKWEIKNQGKSSFAAENQFGFGGEEWLFNPRYNIKGYQYGYIRGLMDVTNIDYIDEAILFTIDPISKDRKIVGKIKRLELLEPTDPTANISAHFDKFFPDIKAELKIVKADYSRVSSKIFYPVVRFKMEDVTLYQNLIIVNALKADNKYNRFKPYKIDSSLQSMLDGVLKPANFNFNPGKRKSINASYTRNNKEKSSFIPGVHADIIKTLEHFLKPDFEISKGNISIEKTEFGGNIADVVLLHKENVISILEVKTSFNTRSNISDALGQLIDYALWFDDIKIHKLVIIAPSLMPKEELEYFKRIQKTINIRLEYWQYLISVGSSPNFIKVI